MLTIAAITMSCTLFSCGGDKNASIQNTSEPTISAVTTYADTVITNANVYTVNSNRTWAEAITIKDGNIQFVGSSKGAEKYINDQTILIDAQGKLLLPGFHDIHMHPLESGSSATHFVLQEYDTEEGYQDALYQVSMEHGGNNWLIGYGPSIEALLEFAQSPATVIDEVINERPVIIMEQTSHAMWVNSKALALAGIDVYTQNPEGGVIGRSETGKPNGILYDNAGNLVMDLAMKALANEGEQNYDSFVQYTQPELLAHGITSISDARVYWQRGQLDTWLALAEDDALLLRVSLGLWAYPQADDDAQLSALKSFYQVNEYDKLNVNQIKFYMDGILVNTTAAMKAPYLDSWLNLPNNKGLNYFTQSRMEKYIKALEPVGYDFNIHAIGDRGIAEALNAIESASNGSARHRLTHVEVVDESDISRFKALNVIADAQVAGDFANPEHWHHMEPLLGKDRAEQLIPIKSLNEAGATLTLSSDWNVSSFNPFIGLANAVSREPQAISIEQAIEAYTINAAYAQRQDTELGSLEVGKRADLVMVDRNILTLPANQIKNAQIVMTLVDGKVVYKR